MSYASDNPVKCCKCDNSHPGSKFHDIRAWHEGWYVKWDGEVYCPDHLPEYAKLAMERRNHYAQVAEARWTKCNVISDYAKSKGLNAGPETVNKNYQTWCEWFEGRLQTGYLVRKTGVTYIKK
jgi:hypothetical protein